MKRIALHWQIFTGIAAGVLIGIFIPRLSPYLDILGQIFIRGLKMIVVPLIISSLICGITNISGGKNIGRIGAKTIVYYLSTSLLAILVGLVLVNIWEPGKNVNIEMPSADSYTLSSVPLSETITNIVPENIFNAMVKADMLAIIFISILFGAFINKLEKARRELLTNVFDAIFDLMMKITLFIIRFAPLGVMAIVSGVVAEQAGEPEKLAQLAGGLGNFAKVVVVGLMIHFFFTLPLILWIIGKVNPIKHYKSMISVVLTAFSTASSNATLPLTMETIENKTGVSNKIASFTLPLGATINMDGTALYELVVAGFVAQILGYELTFVQQFVLVSTALLASIGTAGIPMASFVTMAIIFSAVGLPLEAMFIVMPVDRPLDMMRTATNVFSDTIGTLLIAKSEGEKLNY